MKKFLTAAVAALVVSGGAALAQGIENGDIPDRLVLGMVPSGDVEVIVDTMDDIGAYLSEQLLIPVDTFVSTNYVGLVEALGTGRVDIGMFGPSTLVQAVDLYGAEVILGVVRFGSSTYYAQFTVRNDSGITEFEQLEGKTISFVDPGSSSGYQFPHVFLLEEYGIDSSTDMNAIFAGSHPASVIAMFMGDVDVALSFDDARENVLDEHPTIMEETNILGFTNPIPNDGVVVRSGLDADLVSQIQQALIGMADSEEGLTMLDDLFNGTGFEIVEDSSFDIVRSVAREFQRD